MAVATLTMLPGAWVLALPQMAVALPCFARLSTKLAILSIGGFGFYWLNLSPNHLLGRNISVGMGEIQQP